MTPAVKYTLGRVGLFVLVAVVLLPFKLNIFLTLLIALLVSMVLSYFLLRRWRNELAEQIAGASAKRRQQKEQLRAALAGEDEPSPDTKPSTAAGQEPGDEEE